jgi:hypothetical protein
MNRRRFLRLASAALPASLAVQPKRAKAAGRPLTLYFSGLCAFVPDYVNEQLYIAMLDAPDHEQFLVAPAGSTGGGTWYEVSAEELKRWRLVDAGPASGLRKLPLQERRVDLWGAGDADWDQVRKAGQIRAAHGEGALRPGWDQPRASGGVTAALVVCAVGRFRDGTPTHSNCGELTWKFLDNEGAGNGTHSQKLTDNIRCQADANLLIQDAQGASQAITLADDRGWFIDLPRTTVSRETDVLEHFSHFYELYKRRVPKTARHIPKASICLRGGDPVFCPPAMF